MKTKILFIVLAWSMALSAWSQPSALSSLPSALGFLVAIDNPGERLQLVKTTSLTEVYALSEINFPGNCIAWEKELGKSVFYQIESRNRCFYVELKKVNKNGKYRKVSNREFSRMTIKN
jgi:hypothetical protein